MSSTQEVKTFGRTGGPEPVRRSSRLRSLVSQRYSEGKAILTPTAHDCTTAKIFEQAGVEHINVAGAAPTAIWTGEPECGVVTTTEMIHVAHRILGCTSIPGKVSIAQGGNTLATIRAFREYERTGAALIQIEDQPTGHFSGYIPGKEIIPLEDMISKIKAVRYAREDPDVIIAARCDAKLAVGGGMDELLKRCRAYVDAGAESLMPHGMETMDEWELMGREMRKLGVPLIASLSAGLIFTPKDQPKRSMPTVSQLEDMGWTMLNYANHLLHLHMTITQRYVQDLMAAPHDIGRWLEDVMNNGERMGILGLPMWRALEETFENPDKVSSRYKKTREKDNYVYDTLDQARESLGEILRAKGIS